MVNPKRKFTVTIALTNIEMKQELCPQSRACAGPMPLVYTIITFAAYLGT